MVGINPLDDTRASQRLQPADVALDVGLVIAAWDADAGRLSHGTMRARTIVAGVACELSDIAVCRTRMRIRGSNLDDCADPRLFDCRRLSNRDMVDAAVDAVDNEGESLTEFIGQPLADHAADYRRGGLLAAQDVAAERPLFAARSDRAIDRLDDIATLAQIP